MNLTGPQIVKATGRRKMLCYRYEFSNRQYLFEAAALAKREGWTPIELDAKALVLKIAKPEKNMAH